MCVIIHKPAGVGFKEEDIRCAFDNNPDGFGFMYYHPERDKLIARKMVGLGEDDIIKIFENLKPFDAVIHYRFRTVGAVVDAQCHPFKILDKKKHGVDMYFMHNGTVNNTSMRLKGESDTQCFNRTVLKPILAKTPSLVRTPAFQHIIQDYIGTHSKLCFMYGKGKVIKINESAGSERNGCWVSNNYSFQDGYRTNKAASTTRNAYGGTGGAVNGFNRTKTTVTTPTTKGTDGKTAIFLGSEVTVGEDAWVYSQTDEAFWAEGKIVELKTTCAVIEFENEHKKIVKVEVWLTDGHSWGTFNTDKKYYAIPACEYDKDTLVLTVAEKKQQQGTGEKPSNVVALDEKKDENTSKNSPTKAKATTKDLFTPVSFGEDTVDAEFRYGETVDAIDDDYGGVTIQEFYIMPAQDRFNWYNENLEQSFNMLQDLAENIVMQDTDYELDMYEEYEETQERGKVTH